MTKKNGNGNNGDYEVGYGRPPKHSRWKPGQSGNPRGPERGSRGLRTDLHKALQSRHSIRINGKVVRGTTQELALYALAVRAAAGDIRSIRQLIDVTLQVFGPEDRSRDRKSLPKQDQELLERLFENLDEDEEENSHDDPSDGAEDSGGVIHEGDAPDSDSSDDDGEADDEA
jgi:hypothetical protein